MPETAIKERGLLCTDASVQAIRRGATMTRRVITSNQFRPARGCSWDRDWPKVGSIRPVDGEWRAYLAKYPGVSIGTVRCPYGKVGDGLYVREGFRCTGGGDWKGLLYRADGPDTAKSLCGVNDGRARTLPQRLWPDWDQLVYETRRCCNWRSPLFMPRWASRELLEITGVRVERVQDITPEDAIAEGVTTSLVAALLTHRADKADVGEHYWVHGHGSGESYCERCIDKAVRKAQRLAPDAEIDASRSPWPDGDGPKSCESCGRTVEYTLTDWGVGADLDHFDSYSPGWPLTTHDAFALEQLFDAVCGDWSGEHGPDAARLGFHLLWDSLHAAPKPRYRTVKGRKVIDHYVSHPWAGDPERRQHRGLPWIIYPNPWVWPISFRRLPHD